MSLLERFTSEVEQYLDLEEFAFVGTRQDTKFCWAFSRHLIDNIPAYEKDCKPRQDGYGLDIHKGVDVGSKKHFGVGEFIFSLGPEAVAFYLLPSSKSLREAV